MNDYAAGYEQRQEEEQEMIDDLRKQVEQLQQELDLEKHVNYKCYLLLDEDGRMETGIHIPDEAVSMVFDMMRECRAVGVYQLATGMSIAMYECGVTRCDMCRGTKTELVVKYEDEKEVSREERPCSFCNEQGWRLIDEKDIDDSSSD